MKHNQPEAFPYWWTREEYATDRRTGAQARIMESTGGWRWVVADNQMRHEGVSTTQKGARAACRRVVRKLPSRP